ncbi:DgyrCDS2309 [Dimorphilus gyrociliatus]|uniref:DgyrCDS2309 n=1 Tax=Dimorphilus gyrociliatus TaxID=2664684 RepID=A0A7I8V9W0_9ANNE|nr:DgyrCDS2309 [Dimorphilus gyrociliatus]
MHNMIYIFSLKALIYIYLTDVQASQGVGELEIELRNGRKDNEGLLFVRDKSRQNSPFGTICDDGWDQYEVNTVCRQLGYESGILRQAPFFGMANKLVPIYIDDVKCTKYTSKLENCTFYRKWGNHNCKHYEDVGVSCYGQTAKSDYKEPMFGAGAIWRYLSEKNYKLVHQTSVTIDKIGRHTENVLDTVHIGRFDLRATAGDQFWIGGRTYDNLPFENWQLKVWDDCQPVPNQECILLKKNKFDVFGDYALRIRSSPCYYKHNFICEQRNISESVMNSHSYRPGAKRSKRKVILITLLVLVILLPVIVIVAYKLIKYVNARKSDQMAVRFVTLDDKSHI